MGGAPPVTHLILLPPAPFRYWPHRPSACILAHFHTRGKWFSSFASKNAPRALADGNIVRLGDFGTSGLRVRSVGADTEEAVGAQKITKVVASFRPGKRFGDGLDPDDLRSRRPSRRSDGQLTAVTFLWSGPGIGPW